MSIAAAGAASASQALAVTNALPSAAARPAETAAISKPAEAAAAPPSTSPDLGNKVDIQA